MKQISDEDLTTYLELARRALADGDIFDEMAERMDISDEEMIRLRDQLNEYMDGSHDYCTCCKDSECDCNSKCPEH